MARQWAKQWSVQGSAKEPYTVSVDYHGNWACSCIGWTRHTPRKDCKHIRAKQPQWDWGFSKESRGPVSVASAEPGKKKLYIRSNRKGGL